MRLHFLLVFLLALLPMTTTFADTPTPIRYTLRFPEPQSHYVEVEAHYPTDGQPSLDLFLAVWSPGSYLVREYARHLENIEALSPDAQPLSLEKTRKNRWHVETQGADSITLKYRVYCREMSVQTNWVDSSFAMLNGDPTFLSIVGQTKRPHAVTLELPPGWLRSLSGLPNTDANQFLSPDYDTLVDSPIYAGNPSVYTFEVDGKPHYLVNEGEGGIWDGPRSAKDVEAIVKTERDFWGFLPYDKYLFFNILSETGGGLEHKNSTVLMASRWATRRHQDYLGWLNLVAHEYFHTWNVKRLRPVELGPFDYENEVHTRSLWVAEGITSYYDRLIVRRAGLCTIPEFLQGDPPGPSSEVDRARNDLEVLQDTPGRLVQPLESASFDAWIKFYRRDENTRNTAISYYTKGAVVAFLLDAEVRRATDNKKSLDDVMHLAYKRYSGEKGFTPGEFRAVAQEVAGVDLSAFFHRALETTDELDYQQTLSWFGLRFAEPKKKDNGAPEKAWLGLSTKNDDGRLVVSAVKRDTPGFEAGFNVGDEILAIGDERIVPSQWSKRQEQFRPNETVSVLIARRNLLRRLDATFGQEPAPKFAIELDPNADEAAQAHRRSWIGQDDAPKPPDETPK